MGSALSPMGEHDMINDDPGEPRATPRDTAESEEEELSERSATERDPGDRASRGDEDDPREAEGWTQPESSAQKGGIPYED
jgi:hypothetical protein